MHGTATLVRTAGLALLLAVGGCSTGDWSARARSEPAGPWAMHAANDPYERGKTHLRVGQLGLALEAFRTALRRDRASIASLNGMAVTYDELGRYDVSRRYFQQALELNPQAPETLNNIGRSLLRQGKFEAALPLLREAARSTGDSEVIAANLELASHRLAHRDAQAQDEPTIASAGERLPPWVERTSSSVQTLVTALVLSQNAEAPATQAWAAHVAGLEAARRHDGIGRLPALAVRRTETPDPAAAPAPRLEVSNGAGRRHMAARMRSYLARHGLEVARLTNAHSFAHQDSVIFFRPGHLGWAKQVARFLPQQVRLEERPDQPSEVRLRLGGDLLDFDLTLLAS